MSVANGDRLVTKQDLLDFYDGIRPYMGGMPEVLANKFSKGDLYSIDEKMIGQWADGKPLYQKTYLSITISGSTGRSYKNIVDLSSLSIDTFVDAWGRWNDNATSKAYSMADQYQRQSLTYNSSTGFLQLLQYDGTATMAGWVTVVYTKTTDSAISIGDDTDYSTEEKIVGTWIDGSPVYQRVVSLETITLGTTYELNISSWNMNKMLNAWGFGQLYFNGIDQGRYIFPSMGTGNYNQNVYIKGNMAGTTIVIYSTTASVSGTQRIQDGYLVVQYTKTTD